MAYLELEISHILFSLFPIYVTAGLFYLYFYSSQEVQDDSVEHCRSEAMTMEQFSLYCGIPSLQLNSPLEIKLRQHNIIGYIQTSQTFCTRS